MRTRTAVFIDLFPSNLFSYIKYRKTILINDRIASVIFGLVYFSNISTVIFAFSFKSTLQQQAFGKQSEQCSKIPQTKFPKTNSSK